MATLLSDTFTGTDGTLLTAHTMDVGAGWTNQTITTYKIASNKATFNSGGGGQGETVADAGAADVTITCDHVVGSGGDAGVVFNDQDTNNYWLLAANTTWILYKQISGSFTSVATGGTITAGVSYAVSITTAGDTVTVLIDGSAPFSAYTAASRPLKTATKVGIRNFAATTNTWDNFLVTSAGGGAVVVPFNLFQHSA